MTFDHHSAEANADPIEYYAQFRDKCPVGHTDAHGGFFYTTRYADVVRIARDDVTFSSARSDHGGTGVGIVIPKGHGLEQYPIELDPPASVDYRDLINPLLTPAAVDALVPMIAGHAARIVDEFVELGLRLRARSHQPAARGGDLDWLGFPAEDWPKLAAPIHDIFAALAGSERAMRGAAGLGYMDQRIRELIRERKVTPTDDATSAIVAGRRADGTEFTEDELVSVIGLLIAGGVDTTTSLTGWTLVHLSRHPDQRRKLIESPDLLDAATDEFLRAFTPAQAMARTVTTDAEVGGCPMHAGDRVLIPWVAANHDPDVFPEPTEVRLDRDASRHLAFGIGTHRCAGAHLARAMFREMMTQVLTRLPDYQFLEDGLVPYPTQGNQTGWDALPARVHPGHAGLRCDHRDHGAHLARPAFGRRGRNDGRRGVVSDAGPYGRRGPPALETRRAHRTASALRTVAAVLAVRRPVGTRRGRSACCASRTGAADRSSCTRSPNPAQPSPCAGRATTSRSSTPPTTCSSPAASASPRSWRWCGRYRTPTTAWSTAGRRGSPPPWSAAPRPSSGVLSASPGKSSVSVRTIA